MSVLITSFQESKKATGEKYSVATFQPKGFSYNQLPFLAPLDPTGRRIHLLDNSKNSLAEFKKAVREGYENRWHIISKWLSKLSNEKDIVLCCWCPYSQGSKEQIKQKGYFICHIGLIALMIKKHRPDIVLLLGEKHQKLLHADWHPFPESLVEESPFEEITF